MFVSINYEKQARILESQIKAIHSFTREDIIWLIAYNV